MKLFRISLTPLMTARRSPLRLPPPAAQSPDRPAGRVQIPIQLDVFVKFLFSGGGA